MTSIFASKLDQLKDKSVGFKKQFQTIIDGINTNNQEIREERQKVIAQEIALRDKRETLDQLENDNIKFSKNLEKMFE